MKVERDIQESKWKEKKKDSQKIQNLMALFSG